MSVNISGAKVLITGATGGLGQAMARELSARGAKLVLTGRRTSVLEPLAAETGAELDAVDLADRDAVQALIDRSGDVDILIANAALPGSGTLDQFTDEQIDKTLDVNLRTPIVMARALAPQMVARGRGALLFISSLSGKSANPASSMYSATKFGLRGFALALREDLHGTGVGVSLINPGFIRNAGMFAESNTELPKGVGTRTPEDVAGAVVRAIEKNPAELDVAPLSLRAGAAFSLIAPALSAKAARRMGSADIATRMAQGQAVKRG